MNNLVETGLNIHTQDFLALFRPDISSNATFTLLSVDGGDDPQGPFDGGEEANLDVEYVAGQSIRCLG